MLIDCDSCLARDVHCADCVITVLLAQPGVPARRTELDDAEFAALGSLAEVGLVPPLRLVALVESPVPVSSPGVPRGHVPWPRRSGPNRASA